MDAMEDHSYRQVGTRSAGTVCRGNAGRTVTAVLKQTASSIPSKFETTLHQGTEEKHAFGSRVHRFRHHDDPLPGPGAYHRASTLVREAETCGSVSQRGYSTGFASKTDRFAKKDEIISTLAPGPGSYRTYSTNNTVDAHDFRQSQSQAVFAPPTHSSAQSRGDTAGVPAEVPGPGAYNLSVTSPAQLADRMRANVVFKSAATRFPPSKRVVESANLAPGAYDVAASSDAVQGQGRLVAGRDPQNATFTSKVERSRYFNQRVAAAAKQPGPGRYDDQAAFCAVKDVGPGAAAAAAQSSAAFANTQQDRFGRAYVPKAHPSEVPGPGWYEASTDARLGGGLTHEGALLMTQPSSSMFTSKSARMSDHKGARQRQNRAPGPAYYKPEASGRKSFMLNTSGKWV